MSELTNCNMTYYRLINHININKKKEQELMKIVNINDEHAFVVVNETKYVENGYFK